jgi:xanthine dehydrogenase accessory factor
VLAEHGVTPGEIRDGIRFARSMCPSRGTMDIFVEPVIPRPMLVICGSSPVAQALASLAPSFDFAVTACAPEAELAAFAGTACITGYDLTTLTRTPYIVIATQGKGDEAALRCALAIDAAYLAFVGSRRKMAALRARLSDASPDRLASVRAPAGLDLGAITPAEIALSIMAEILGVRRRGQRAAQGSTSG